MVVRDEIHGDIDFNLLLKAAIDHPYFQRLRWIKQLGLADFVFPCATHTRFQHSMGAAYLAGQYFENLIKNWLAPPSGRDFKEGSTELLFQATQACVEAVSFDPNSRQYWKDITMMSGLLHDIGHGPWSHTFETLDLAQDYETQAKALTGPVGGYYRERVSSKAPLMHEDLSVFYLHQLFLDLHKKGQLENAELYWLSLAMLISKPLQEGKVGEAISQRLSQLFREQHIEGGLEFHQLIRPLISGPFDVDRIDYIQRDGRNCGVNIGNIEWRRIVGKLMPCLSREDSGVRSVVLISNMKNQHVLDAFVFSLFQMYTQVYLHPKVVGLEYLLKKSLVEDPKFSKEMKIDFEFHSRLSDERWREYVQRKFRIEAVEGFLMRADGYDFDVAAVRSDSEREITILKQEGYVPLKPLDRPMLKETIPVYLYSRLRRGEEELVISQWQNSSPIAAQFHRVNYTPSFWIKTTS